MKDGLVLFIGTIFFLLCGLLLLRYDEVIAILSFIAAVWWLMGFVAWFLLQRKHD